MMYTVFLALFCEQSEKELGYEWEKKNARKLRECERMVMREESWRQVSLNPDLVVEFIWWLAQTPKLRLSKKTKKAVIVNCFCFSFYQTIDQVKIKLIEHGSEAECILFLFFFSFLLSPSTHAFYGVSTFRMTFTSGILFWFVDFGLNWSVSSIV